MVPKPEPLLLDHVSQVRNPSHVGFWYWGWLVSRSQLPSDLKSPFGVTVGTDGSHSGKEAADQKEMNRSGTTGSPLPRKIPSSLLANLKRHC